MILFVSWGKGLDGGNCPLTAVRDWPFPLLFSVTQPKTVTTMKEVWKAIPGHSIARERWPVWMVYSIFCLKALNSVIVRIDWWKVESCWHLWFDLWCYPRYWYFTFSYRRWEMIVPAILILYEKSKKGEGLNGWVYITLLTFYVYELVEYWVINNMFNKTWISLAMIAIFMVVSVWSANRK